MFIWLFAILFFKSYSTESYLDCITPNGKNAKCIPIDSCTVIKEALVYLNPEVVDFARKSQCGYDKGPLVCCGSSSRVTTPPSKVSKSTTEYNNDFIEDKKTASPLDDQFLPDRSICGIQIKQTDNKLIGGNRSHIYDFPWMVELKYVKDDGSDAGYRCAGSLISANFVLTAAHCLQIKGYNLIGVRLGEWRTSTNTDCFENLELLESVCSDPVIDLRIVKEIAHPFFSTNSGNNDIALLKLEKKVAFTDFIRPICLPPPELPDPKNGSYMSVGGWGITEEGIQSDYKLKVEVPLLSNEKCKEVFTTYTHNNPNQACVSRRNSDNPYRGDSGGPVMTTFSKADITDDEQWYQEGLIYGGIGDFSLYLRISKYSRWILNTIHTS